MKPIFRTLLAGVVISGAFIFSSMNYLHASPIARIQTNRGEIVIDLNAEKAPKTVANFISYATEGFYEGTIFHRVIKGFMIQGGGLTGKLEMKKTKPPIPNEADNGLKNLPGTIAMARTSDPHSATAQFFINVVDNTPLDHVEKNNRGWGYCVFGKVIKGMDIVKAIENVPTTKKMGHADVPLDEIVIKKVIIEKTKEK